MQVKDPVCGMAIDSTKAQAKEVYQGPTYFFCSDQCHRQFLAAPERYVATKKTDEASETGRGNRS